MKANLAKPIKTKVCAACRQTLPLTAFQRNENYGRVAMCKACQAAEQVGAQKDTSHAPLNNTAESAHIVQASLKREPRADGRLCAHNELEFRGPVPRPGSASPRLEQCIKTFGGR